MLQQSQESHGNSGKSACANIGIGTHYDAIKDVSVPGEFRSHMNTNTVWNNMGMTTSGQMLILRQNLKSKIKNG